LPKDNRDVNGPLKVTDKRIFTAEGEIREEFRNSVTPSDVPPPPPVAEERRPAPPPEERKKSLRDAAGSPGSMFTTFLESLIANAYMSLGLLRSPYAPQPVVDLPAAKQMIDILSMLQEKTAGNITEEESSFFETHLAELKFKYVQKSKAL
jgi:hypothetical protein